MPLYDDPPWNTKKKFIGERWWEMGWERKWILAIPRTQIRAKFQKHATFHKNYPFIQQTDLTKEQIIFFFFSLFAKFHEFINKK